MLKCAMQYDSMIVMSIILGNKPPGLVPNKFLYMTADLHRLSQYFAVPISPPADPFEAMFKKGNLNTHHMPLICNRCNKGRQPNGLHFILLCGAIVYGIWIKTAS